MVRLTGHEELVTIDKLEKVLENVLVTFLEEREYGPEEFQCDPDEMEAALRLFITEEMKSAFVDLTDVYEHFDYELVEDAAA